MDKAGRSCWEKIPVNLRIYSIFCLTNSFWDSKIHAGCQYRRLGAVFRHGFHVSGRAVIIHFQFRVIGTDGQDFPVAMLQKGALWPSIPLPVVIPKEMIRYILRKRKV